MAKTTKYYASMKEVLETFDLKKFKSWVKKYNPILFTSFKDAPEEVQMATMCKMICNFCQSVVYYFGVTSDN